MKRFRRWLFNFAAAVSLLLCVCAIALLSLGNQTEAIMYHSDSFGRILVIYQDGVIGYSTEQTITPAGKPDSTWTYKSGGPAVPKGQLGQGIGATINTMGFPVFYIALIATVLPGMWITRYLRRRKLLSN